jgi:hypothetical protein
MALSLSCSLCVLYLSLPFIMSHILLIFQIIRRHPTCLVPVYY